MIKSKSDGGVGNTYKAPEVLSSKKFVYMNLLLKYFRPSSKSDVFSLGTIVHQLMAKGNPFLSREVFSNNQKLVKDNIDINPDKYSKELIDLVQRMIDPVCCLYLLLFTMNYKREENRPSMNQLLQNPLLRPRMYAYREELQVERLTSRPAGSSSTTVLLILFFCYFYYF
jgi:serine/threonine protein kinase